ncbi:MAG: DUF1272 domain-containing protein [Myxococcales bacterium]|nr:DUF1272 domain-containing protein [Myxococcales bacterium]
MLELRPNCEACDKDLPPSSGEAMICSFECTFCRDCVDGPLQNVCPNCGGGLTLRPVRPSALLKACPPSTERKGPGYDQDKHAELVAKYGAIPPHER